MNKGISHLESLVNHIHFLAASLIALITPFAAATSAAALTPKHDTRTAKHLDSTAPGCAAGQ